MNKVNPNEADYLAIDIRFKCSNCFGYSDIYTHHGKFPPMAEVWEIAKDMGWIKKPVTCPNCNPAWSRWIDGEKKEKCSKCLELGKTIYATTRSAYYKLHGHDDGFLCDSHFEVLTQ